MQQSMAERRKMLRRETGTQRKGVKSEKEPFPTIAIVCLCSWNRESQRHLLNERRGAEKHAYLCNAIRKAGNLPCHIRPFVQFLQQPDSGHGQYLIDQRKDRDLHVVCQYHMMLMGKCLLPDSGNVQARAAGAYFSLQDGRC